MTKKEGREENQGCFLFGQLGFQEEGIEFGVKVIGAKGKEKGGVV